MEEGSVKRCCATCDNMEVQDWFVIPTRCIVARRHMLDPWREWLDNANEPNTCRYWEPKESWEAEELHLEVPPPSCGSNESSACL